MSMETLQETHKVHKPERFEMTRELLKENTTFKWFLDEQRFGGFNKEELQELVATVGELIGITPEQAKKISTVFGEHVQYDYKEDDVKSYINGAYCVTIYEHDDLKEVDNCIVVINRSVELVNSQDDPDKYEEKKRKKNENGMKVLECVFENPWEFVAWLVAEELKHAQMDLIGETKKSGQQWQERYEEILTNKNRIVFDDYSSDLGEVTASRTALSVLWRLAENNFPERVEYFKKLHNESIQEFTNVVPTVGRVMNNVYLKTGYKK